MRKATLIALFLTGKLAFAQTGIITAKLEIRDKNDLAKINGAFIENILNDNCKAFKDKRFLIPDSKEKITNTIKEYRLAKRKIKTIYTIIEWDVKKKQGTILGYNPVYRMYCDTTFYFIPADIHDKLDSNISGYLRESSKNAIFRSIKSSRVKSIHRKQTIREIKTSDFSHIVQYPLSQLPFYLGRNCLEGILTFYADPELTFPLTLDEIISITRNKYPQNPLAIKKIYLYESWTFMKNLNTENKQSTYSPGSTITLQKNIKSIGLKAGKEIILWADYKEVEFISDADKKADGDIKFDLYKTYFESSFCKKVKMELIQE